MRKSLLLVFAMWISLSLTSLAQQTGDVPVTSGIIDYFDVPGVPRIYMQVQSDGASVYKNSKSVKSVIQGIGDWELDTGVNIKSPTRKAYLDFTQAIAGSGPNGGNPTPPFATGLVRPRFISKTSQYDLSMFTISYGQTVNAPLNIGFNYPIGGSDLYRIHMTPYSNSIFPYPEIDYVDITCTGQDANLQCNKWQIRPNGTKGGCVTEDCSVKRNVAKLVKVVSVRGNTTEENLGDFYMSFAIDITKP